MLQYYMRYGKIDTSLDRNISYILYYVMKPLKKYFFHNSSIKVYIESIYYVDSDRDFDGNIDKCIQTESIRMN